MKDARKRRLNESIRQSAPPREQRLAFVCECPDPGCFLTVWLTPAEFEATRDDPDRAVWLRLGLHERADVRRPSRLLAH